jgi:signal transduction histidine kinase
VKIKPEEKKGDSFIQNVPAGENGLPREDSHKILNISASEHIHEAVYEHLKYFSFNGKKITILKALSLQEARKVAKNHPDIILVVIDNNIQLNGSYHDFVSYIREDLKNDVCHIAFKDNMIPAAAGSDSNNKEEKAGKSEFEFARERLLEMIRMMMLTCEMESKFEGNRLLDNLIINSNNTSEGKSTRSANITREKLYTILAHDIKEPIGNIKVILDFLTNERDLLDMKTSKELLRSVQESASSIHELLDNFLFWTRLHKQEIYFNPVKINLAHLVRENITLLKGIATNKNIFLHADVNADLDVFADEYMMTTVMRNLIYNAVKFTSRMGGISISAKDIGGAVELSVNDTGVGMKKTDIEKLFNPEDHFKLNGTASETGTGLGLILCKDFIEKNGGKITVESDEGFGSTFTFTIPKWKTISVN